MGSELILFYWGAFMNENKEKRYLTKIFNHEGTKYTKEEGLFSLCRVDCKGKGFQPLARFFPYPVRDCKSYQSGMA